MYQVAVPLSAANRGMPHATQTAVPLPSIHILWYTNLRSWWRVTCLFSLPYIMVMVFYSRFSLRNEMVYSELEVGVAPCNSSAGIGYQVDNFTHTCLAEEFFA